MTARLWRPSLLHQQDQLFAARDNFKFYRDLEKRRQQEILDNWGPALPYELPDPMVGGAGQSRPSGQQAYTGPISGAPIPTAAPSASAPSASAIEVPPAAPPPLHSERVGVDDRKLAIPERPYSTPSLPMTPSERKLARHGPNTISPTDSSVPTLQTQIIPGQGRQPYYPPRPEAMTPDERKRARHGKSFDTYVSESGIPSPSRVATPDERKLARHGKSTTLPVPATKEGVNKPAAQTPKNIWTEWTNKFKPPKSRKGESSTKQKSKLVDEVAKQQVKEVVQVVHKSAPPPPKPAGQAYYAANPQALGSQLRNFNQYAQNMHRSLSRHAAFIEAQMYNAAAAGDRAMAGNFSAALENFNMQAGQFMLPMYDQMAQLSGQQAIMDINYSGDPSSAAQLLTSLLGRQVDIVPAGQDTYDLIVDGQHQQRLSREQLGTMIATNTDPGFREGLLAQNSMEAERQFELQKMFRDYELKVDLEKLKHVHALEVEAEKSGSLKTATIGNEDGSSSTLVIYPDGKMDIVTGTTRYTDVENNELDVPIRGAVKTPVSGAGAVTSIGQINSLQ